MENILHIQQFAIPHIEINTGPQEFFHQQRDIKTVGIITREITSIEDLF